MFIQSCSKTADLGEAFTVILCQLDTVEVFLFLRRLMNSMEDADIAL